MKKILLILVILVLGCSQELIIIEDERPFLRPVIDSLTLMTDKDGYHSKELIEMTVEISSNTTADNLQLVLYGIEVRGNNLIYEVIPINLTEGNNIIKFGFELPECNRCSGLPPGGYTLNAEIYYENRMIKRTEKKVTLG